MITQTLENFEGLSQILKEQSGEKERMSERATHVFCQTVFAYSYGAQVEFFI